MDVPAPPERSGLGASESAEILDRLSEGVVVFDREWRYRYINRAAEAYLGSPREGLLGKVESTIAVEYVRAAASNTANEVEMLSPVTKGRVAHRIVPSDGGLTVYLRDVSEQRQASDSLRDSEPRFRALFDHTLDGVMLTAPSGAIFAANPAACAILRRSEAEICRLGRHGVVDLTDPRLAPLMDERQRTGRARGELTFIRGDGVKITVEISSSVFSDRAGELLTSMSIRDVTDRKRSEEALRLLAEVGADLTTSLDREDIVHLLTTLLVPRFADVCIVDVEAGGAKTPQMRPTNGDDALGARSALRFPFLLADEPIGGMTLVLRDESRRFDADDITTLQAVADRAALAIDNARLYEEAINARRVRDDVLTMVSHDLRNPVNAIAMVAAGLAKAGRTPGAAEMHEAATLANRMIDDLMAVVSIESGTLELYPTAVSLGALADEIVSIFRPPATVRGIELIARVEPAGLTAQVDRYRLLQAVSNVVANAVKFSPNGGRINIDVKEAGDDVEIVISDEGPGIPAEETEHIFDRFWRSPRRRQRSTGAGLGLTITRGCVEAHRGRIRVDSQPGRGATFTIAVPKRSTDGVGAVLAPLGPSEPGQGKE